MARITQQSSIGTTGTSFENEPIVKSDGASSDVMEWAASTGSSAVKITEGADNKLDLTVDGKPVVAGVQSDGAGLHFDGAAGHVEATALSLSTATQYSFEVIFTTEDATTSCVLIGNSNSSTTRKVLGFKDGILRLGYKEASWAAVSGGTIEANTVYHVVGTRDGATQKIYINGNEVTSGTLDSIYFGATAAMRLAYSGDSSDKQHFSGTIYRARVYNKALSSTEVQTAFERADVDFADQYGRQALTDGNFPNADNWSVNDTGSGWAIGSNKATFTQTGSIYGSITQTGVFTSADVGKKVHVTFEIETATASLLVGSDAADVYTGTSYQPYTVGVHTVSFTMPSGQTTIGFWAGNTSPTFSIKNIGVHVEGCVSDYDLAFANPTQSLMVQDRSGAADGTAHTSGVTQVQPVVQLNATAARVGTTAATPADGELISGKLTVGASASTDTLAGFTDSQAAIVGGDNVGLALKSTNINKSARVRFFDHSGNQDATVGFDNSNSNLFMGTGTSAHLSIDASGQIGVGKSPSTNQAIAYGPSVQVGQAAALIGAGGANNLFLSSNALFNNSDWKLTNDGQAGQLFINTDGSFTFRQERTSGSANDNISWDTALTIDSSGHLTLASSGITIPAGQHLKLDGGGDTYIYEDTANSIAFTTGGVVRLTLNASGLASFSNGIAFTQTNSSATGAAVATNGTILDHYEEGTWTPVFSVGGIAGSNISYIGRYTRIGKLVYIYCKIAASANDLVIGNYVGLSGLPFTAAASASGFSTTEDIDLDLGGEVNIGGTTIFFGATGSATATQTITATLTYEV